MWHYERATFEQYAWNDLEGPRSGNRKGEWTAIGEHLRRWLIGTAVRANSADSGGGIWVGDAPSGGDTSLVLDGDSSVTGNTPDDCYGTTAC